MRSNSAATSPTSRSTRCARYASLVGLDPDTVVAGDRLTFDPAQRFSFLHLLNEDLYKGQLTDELFEAHRKIPAGG